VRRRIGRTALIGIVLGLVTAAVVEVVRPRGGTAVLLDWDRVRGTAKSRLASAPTDMKALAGAARSYRAMAAKLEDPLLAFVGGLPKGAVLPAFEALDRDRWLDVNLTILRRVIDPILEQGRVPNSLLVEAGRAGLDHWVAFMLAFLGRRVLGQYDPQLLGTEPIESAGLYLVEPNVEEWRRTADLPGPDLRRWLILHEMTHAWQFSAHPWLRGHIESSMRSLLESTSKQTSPAVRLAAFAGVLPSQWRIMRQVQATMSLIEGYSNLVMNQVGRQVLRDFDRLETAYKSRSAGKGIVEILIWKFTGLDLKLQQYRQGEAFCQAVFEKHGIEALNIAWSGPDKLPRLEELDRPDDWYARVAAGVREVRRV
jgi:coenzyme F420 biosynthesis associated uncharacterized protein